MSESVVILKTNFFKKGGAEKYARCLADAFHARGCLVTVLTTGPLTGSFPYKVLSYKYRGKTSVSKLWEFEDFCEKHLKKNPPDIILGLDRNRFQTHLRASSGVHRSYLENRKKYESKWKRFRHLLNPLHTSLLHIEKAGFENPDVKTIFTNSHLIKNEILDHFTLDPRKIAVVHNGVEWNKWQKPFEDWPSHHNPDRFEFVFIGNNFERKGLRQLLEGMTKLKQRNVHLSVIGKDKHQKRFEKLSFPNNVTFYGEQADIIPFLQKADCLVIPSHYDPFANVTVEALAMGLYVVSSKTNGGSEILTPETGVIIEDLYHPSSVAQALEIALSHPKTPKSAILVRNSVKHLDFSRQLNTYLDLCLSPTS